MDFAEERELGGFRSFQGAGATEENHLQIIDGPAKPHRHYMSQST